MIRLRSARDHTLLIMANYDQPIDLCLLRNRAPYTSYFRRSFTDMVSSNYLVPYRYFVYKSTKENWTNRLLQLLSIFLNLQEKVYFDDQNSLNYEQKTFVRAELDGIGKTSNIRFLILQFWSLLTLDCNSIAWWASDSKNRRSSSFQKIFAICFFTAKPITFPTLPLFNSIGKSMVSSKMNKLFAIKNRQFFLRNLTV